MVDSCSVQDWGLLFLRFIDFLWFGGTPPHPTPLFPWIELGLSQLTHQNTIAGQPIRLNKDRCGCGVFCVAMGLGTTENEDLSNERWNYAAGFSFSHTMSLLLSTSARPVQCATTAQTIFQHDKGSMFHSLFVKNKVVCWQTWVCHRFTQSAQACALETTF